VTAGFQAAFGEVTDKSDSGLEAAFALVDTNRSGKIDAVEMKAYLKESVYGKELDDQTINEMMTAADIDEDGEVSLAEFKTIIRATKIPIVLKAAPVSKGSKWKKAAGIVAVEAKTLNSLAPAPASPTAAAPSPPPSTPAASSNGNSPPDRAHSPQRSSPQPSSPQRSSPDRITSGMPASDGNTEPSLFEPSGAVEQAAATQPATVDAVGNTDELVQRAEAPVQRRWQQWTQQVAASNALVKQLPLPEGWRQGMAPNGSQWIPYYYNTSTGTTQWERPYEPAVITAQAVITVPAVAAEPSNNNSDKGATAKPFKEPAPLRTEWRQARAPNGLTYYYNAITNATQWEPPT
jgi:hypothetical protein